MDDDLKNGTEVTIQRFEDSAGRRTVPLVKEAQLIVAEQRMLSSRRLLPALPVT